MNNQFVEIVRGATRPIVTIIMAAIIAQVIVQGINAPDWFIFGMAMPIILWWFGERTIANAINKRREHED